MADDVKNAMGKMTRVLRLARSRANQQLGKVKERAQEVKERAHRFSMGSSGSASTGNSPDRAEAKVPFAFAENLAWPHDADVKVERLVALGFSAAAARQGLRACGGRLDEAGLWLLDERNADEVFAAEVAAEMASPLVPGGTARVSGLRGASALNGSIVVLQKFDKESERWVVSMPDGSVKSIRSRNLDALSGGVVQSPVNAPDVGIQPEAPASAPSAAGRDAATSVGSQSEALGASLGLDLQELRALAKDMLDSNGQEADDEVLLALGADDLIELIDALGPQDGADEQIGGSQPSSKSKEEAPEPAPSTPQQPVDTEDTDDWECLQKSEAAKISTSSTAAAPSNGGYNGGYSVGSSNADALLEKQQQLDEAEVRLRSLAEAQKSRADELEAREAALRQAEENLAKRRAEAEELAKQAPEAATPEPVKVRIPFVNPVESTPSPAMSSAASPESKLLEAELRYQREELERLREEVTTAAHELQERQEAAKHLAQERELRLLEEESAQMHMASTLKEEEARLNMQRKSLGLLQQAILKGAADRSTFDGPVELSLDDDGVEAEETSKAEASSLEAQAKSSGGEAGKSSEATSEKVAEGKEPSEQIGDDEEDDDEVWDLDWSALGGPKEEPATQAAQNSDDSSK